MSDREWLASLKPGDEVVVRHRQGFSYGKVARITPTRQIVARIGSAEYRFTAKGREVGGGVVSPEWYELEKPSEEHREELHRHRLISSIKATRWSDLPTATLERVVAALEEPGQ